MLRCEQPTAEGAGSVRDWLLSEAGRAVESIEFDGAALQNFDALQNQKGLCRLAFNEFEVTPADEFDTAHLFPTFYEDGVWHVAWRTQPINIDQFEADLAQLCAPYESTACYWPQNEIMVKQEAAIEISASEAEEPTPMVGAAQPLACA